MRIPLTDQFFGPDRQTSAALCAALILGGLVAVGNEVRVFVLRGHIIWPIVFIALYLFTTGLIYAIRSTGRQENAKITVKGHREKVVLREAPAYLASQIADIAVSMGLKEVKVRVIPKTNQVLDAYAVGDYYQPWLVVTGGTGLLSLRKDPVSRSKFDALIRHEMAHLIRSDPDTFDWMAAAGWSALLLAVFKYIVLPIIGLEKAAAWYRIIFPRSFQLENEVMTAIPTPSAVVLGTMLITSILLGLMILALRWVWVRRREYWADHIAIHSSPDPDQCRESLRCLLHGAGLALTLRGGNRLSGLWHPSIKSRIRMIERNRPTLGFYSGTAAILAVSTIFAIRFVLGNNYGINSGDFPQGIWVIGIGLLYLATSYEMVSLLTVPDNRSHYAEALGRLAGVLLAILSVTLGVVFLDTGWTMATTPMASAAPDDFLALLFREMLERVILIGFLGFALTLFALIAFVKNVLLKHEGSLIGMAVSLAAIFAISKTVGEPMVASLRSNSTGLPYTDQNDALTGSTPDEAWDYGDLLASPLAMQIASLPGGYFEFQPPIDCFNLANGPLPTTVWRDSSSVNLPLLLKERLRDWYSKAHKQNPSFQISDWGLLNGFRYLAQEEDYYAEVRRYPHRDQSPLVNRLTRQKPTDEQVDVLTIGLERAVRQGRPSIVQLALELGADPAYLITTEDGFLFGPMATLANLESTAGLEPQYVRCLQLLAEYGANLEQCEFPAIAAKVADEPTLSYLKSLNGNLNPRGAPTLATPLARDGEYPKPDLSNPVEEMQRKLEIGMTASQIHDILGKPHENASLDLANEVLENQVGKAEEYLGSNGRLWIYYDKEGKLEYAVIRPLAL